MDFHPHPDLLPFSFFFPLPWWERIKVRGMLGFPTILALNTKPSTKSWFHPHPDLLPSREKES
jgi:hypothetical protein